MAATADRLRLALIDSRPLVRAAVGYLLETNLTQVPPCFMVQAYASPADFLGQCDAPALEADIVVFNIGSAFTCDPPVQEGLRRLREQLSQVPLVVMCDHVDACHGMDAMRLGINGYIPTMLSPAVAIQAIRLVHAGGIFVPANVVMERLDERRPEKATLHNIALDAFTNRERGVLELMWEGKSNKVIAHHLGVTESTVKVYVRQIMRKLGASNRTHAIFLLSQSIGRGETE